MALSLDIGANTRDAVKGIGDISEALDKSEDALNDLAKAGSKTSDKLSHDLKDAARDGERSADDLEGAFKSSMREISSSNQKATSDLTLGTRERTRLTKEGIKQIGDEAKQNAAQTFSSFDGSAQSFVDGVQGTLGGLVASMGPIGIAIGTVGALGVGLINGALQKADQDSDEFRQHVADLTTQMIQAGITGKRSFSDIISDVQSLATQTDKGKTSLKDLRDIAKTLSVPLRNVVDAYEQGGKPLDDLLAKQKALSKAEDARYKALVGNDPSKVYDGLNPKVSQYQGALDKVNTTLSTQKEALKEAANASEIAAKAGLSDWQLKASLIDQVNTAYDDAAGSVSDYINTETGVFDTAKYIAAMDAREQALKSYQKTLASVDLSPEARKFLESQGADAASSFLAGYQKATPAQRKELNRIWTDAGADDSGSYSASLDKGLSATTVKGPEIKLKAPDVGDITKTLQQRLDRSPLSVKVVAKDQYGRRLS